MAAKGRLAELVAANCPVFYLHPGDIYMPTTVEHFSAPGSPPQPASAAAMRAHSPSSTKRNNARTDFNSYALLCQRLR